MSQELINTLAELMQTVDTVYGIYLDSVAGYKWGKERLEQVQRDMLTTFRSQGEQWTVEQLDAKFLHIGKGEPSLPEARFLHKCTQGQYKLRNSPDGLNHKAIGNLCAVLIYQYWENHYRPLIAELKGIPSNAVRMDIMGDLRFIRESIIHHRAIALPEISKCSLIKWFAPGEEIHFTSDQFEELINLVKRGIVELSDGETEKLAAALASVAS